MMTQQVEEAFAFDQILCAVRECINGRPWEQVGYTKYLSVQQGALHWTTDAKRDKNCHPKEAQTQSIMRNNAVRSAHQEWKRMKGMQKSIARSVMGAS